MFGQPKSRRELQEETGLKGKELTAHLKSLVQQGGVIRRYAYTEPATSAKKQAVYQTVPTNRRLFEAE